MKTLTYTKSKITKNTFTSLAILSTLIITSCGHTKKNGVNTSEQVESIIGTLKQSLTGNSPTNSSSLNSPDSNVMDSSTNTNININTNSEITPDIDLNLNSTTSSSNQLTNTTNQIIDKNRVCYSNGKIYSFGKEIDLDIENDQLYFYGFRDFFLRQNISQLNKYIHKINQINKKIVNNGDKKSNYYRYVEKKKLTSKQIKSTYDKYMQHIKSVRDFSSRTSSKITNQLNFLNEIKKHDNSQAAEDYIIFVEDSLIGQLELFLSCFELLEKKLKVLSDKIEEVTEKQEHKSGLYMHIDLFDYKKFTDSSLLEYENISSEHDKYLTEKYISGLTKIVNDLEAKNKVFINRKRILEKEVGSINHLDNDNQLDKIIDYVKTSLKYHDQNKDLLQYINMLSKEEDRNKWFNKFRRQIQLDIENKLLENLCPKGTEIYNRKFNRDQLYHKMLISNNIIEKRNAEKKINLCRNLLSCEPHKSYGHPYIMADAFSTDRLITNFLNIESEILNKLKDPKNDEVKKKYSDIYNLYGYIYEFTRKLFLSTEGIVAPNTMVPINTIIDLLVFSTNKIKEPNQLSNAIELGHFLINQYPDITYEDIMDVIVIFSSSSILEINYKKNLAKILNNKRYHLKENKNYKNINLETIRNEYIKYQHNRSNQKQNKSSKSGDEQIFIKVFKDILYYNDKELNTKKLTNILLMSYLRHILGEKKLFDQINKNPYLKRLFINKREIISYDELVELIVSNNKNYSNPNQIVLANQMKEFEKYSLDEYISFKNKLINDKQNKSFSSCTETTLLNIIHLYYQEFNHKEINSILSSTDLGREIIKFLNKDFNSNLDRMKYWINILYKSGLNFKYKNKNEDFEYNIRGRIPNVATGLNFLFGPGKTIFDDKLDNILFTKQNDLYKFNGKNIEFYLRESTDHQDVYSLSYLKMDNIKINKKSIPNITDNDYLLQLLSSLDLFHKIKSEDFRSKSKCILNDKLSALIFALDFKLKIRIRGYSGNQLKNKNVNLGRYLINPLLASITSLK